MYFKFYLEIEWFGVIRFYTMSSLHKNFGFYQTKDGFGLDFAEIKYDFFYQ